MKVVKKKLDDGRFQLEALASASEVEKALNYAQLGFARQMKLQPEGNKSISQIVDEKMGIKDLDSVVEGQAIEFLTPFAIDKIDFVPAFLPTALASGPLKRGREFAFRCYVTPKPDYDLSSFDPVEVEVPPFEFDESVVDQQLQEMASQYGDYVDCDRQVVEEGDSCLLSMKCTHNDGEIISGLTSETGRTYTTNAQLMPPGFDEQIIGMKVNETKTFTFEGPDIDEDGNEIVDVVTAEVTVKSVQERVTPEINDEWVSKFMPMYASLEDLKKTLSADMRTQQKEMYNEYVNNVCVSKLAERLEDSISDEEYKAMSKTLQDNLRMQLAAQGMTLEQYQEECGGQEQFNMMMLMQTRETLSQGYALDAAFRHFKLITADEDIEAACKSLNPRNPKGVRKDLEENGRNFALRESAERMRATRYIREHANITVVDPKDQAENTAEEEDAK